MNKHVTDFTPDLIEESQIVKNLREENGQLRKEIQGLKMSCWDAIRRYDELYWRAMQAGIVHCDCAPTRERALRANTWARDTIARWLRD